MDFRQILIMFALMSFVVVSLSFPSSFAQNDQMGEMNMADSSAPPLDSSPAIFTLANSSVQMRMTWEPEAINTNNTTKFTFEFIDSGTEQPLQNVSFSVHMSVGGKSAGHAHELSAPEGIATVEQKFDSTGSLQIIVESIEAGGTPIPDYAQFNLSVVPEFPFSIAIVSALVIGSVVVAAKLVRFRP